jgi:hypothetical protein
METLELMAIFAFGFFLNFMVIYIVAALITGDWSEFKQTLMFTIGISAFCSLGILLG